LPPGLQCAQACHALRLFVALHPEREAAWFAGSNNLAVLNVADKQALGGLHDKAIIAGVKCATFLEPDLGWEPTAIAIAPEGRSLVRRLPLALASK
jgi:hypothetical protein